MEITRSQHRAANTLSKAKFSPVPRQEPKECSCHRDAFTSSAQSSDASGTSQLAKGVKTAAIGLAVATGSFALGASPFLGALAHNETSNGAATFINVTGSAALSYGLAAGDTFATVAGSCLLGLSGAALTFAAISENF